MSIKAIVSLAAILAAASAVDQEVCYGDLGCFSTAPPFSAFGRIALLPESPRDIDTHFLLFTRKNIDVPDEIKANDFHALRNSNFNGKLPTKFIAHGWLDGPGIGPWLADMARQFLVAEDCNAIVVDWHGGGRKLYGQAAANTRVVGAQIAQLITFLNAQTGLDVTKVHVLGHSLGAHVAGYAGERIPGMGRITGMDPADPYFQNMSTVVRLDETDAAFVDVIHTDANDIFTILNPFNDMMGLGLWQPSGHVDVYPNSGKKQPGCGDKGPIGNILSTGVVDGVREIFACGHQRAVDYAHESISSSCPWRSYRCDKGWDEFKTGRCLRCPTTGDKTKSCNGVGYVAVKPSDGSVNNIYYMVTGDKSPYCRYHFHVQLKIRSDKNKEQKGLAWVKLYGERASTGFMQLGEDNFYIKPGATYDFMVTTKDDLGTITSVELKWEHDAAFYEITQWQLGKPEIYPASINVFSGEYQKDAKFCDDTGKELNSKDSRRYTKTC